MPNVITLYYLTVCAKDRQTDTHTHIMRQRKRGRDRDRGRGWVEKATSVEVENRLKCENGR